MRRSAVLLPDEFSEAEETALGFAHSRCEHVRLRIWVYNGPQGVGQTSGSRLKVQVRRTSAAPVYEWRYLFWCMVDDAVGKLLWNWIDYMMKSERIAESASTDSEVRDGLER